MKKVEKLALGTVQFGLFYGIANNIGKISSIAATDILTKAKQFSIHTIDTAINYGESESVLGDYGVNDFKVITKLPKFDGKRSHLKKWFKDQIEASLIRLKIKRVDGLLLHKSTQLLEKYGTELYELLQEAKSENKVNRIGISIYSIDELPHLLDKYKLDLIQFPGNIFDRRMEESGWLKILSEAKIDVHLRSVFLQGLLLIPRQNRPNFFNKWRSLFDQWDNWLIKTNQTPLQACISHALAIEGIEKIVVGVDEVTQLEDIIRATEVQYKEPPFDLKSIDERLINPSLW